ncbi:hypothetical protein D9757_013350 [Collybiopsis confluens]|uniref:RING-type domain-containing protein n=1 Tax=Collybiopsis confluens TaxID=2823264 RepID=A0A8H5CTC3_9AGAR|nr:hypothetical protein D9757_013350 [Collybiopsis confluens]
MPSIRNNPRSAAHDLPRASTRSAPAPEATRPSTRSSAAHDLPRASTRSAPAPELPRASTRSSAAHDLPHASTRSSAAHDLIRASTRSAPAHDLPRASTCSSAAHDLPHASTCSSAAHDLIRASTCSSAAHDLIRASTRSAPAHDLPRASTRSAPALEATRPSTRSSPYSRTRPSGHRKPSMIDLTASSDSEDHIPSSSPSPIRVYGRRGRVQAQSSSVAGSSNPSSSNTADSATSASSATAVASGTPSSSQDERQNLQNLRKLVEDLKGELTCPVCLELAFEPYVAKCGHMYCAQCIMRMQKRAVRQKKEDATCGICRSPFLDVPRRCLSLNNQALLIAAVDDIEVPEAPVFRWKRTWHGY